MMATSSMDEVNAIEAVERPLQVLGPVASQHAANAVFADNLSRKVANRIGARRFDLAVFVDYLADAGITVDAFFGLRHQHYYAMIVTTTHCLCAALPLRGNTDNGLCFLYLHMW